MLPAGLILDRWKGSSVIWISFSPRLSLMGIMFLYGSSSSSQHGNLISFNRSRIQRIFSIIYFQILHLIGVYNFQGRIILMIARFYLNVASFPYKLLSGRVWYSKDLLNSLLRRGFRASVVSYNVESWCAIDFTINTGNVVQLANNNLWRARFCNAVC